MSKLTDEEKQAKLEETAGKSCPWYDPFCIFTKSVAQSKLAKQSEEKENEDK